MRIVLFGTGNLATQLGLALHAKNAEIVQVFGRSEHKCALLSDLLGCGFTTTKSEIRSDAELFILAVTEQAVPEVLSDLPIGERLVVHTSGSVSIDLLSSFAKNYGVFYPLQTLSKQKEIDFRTVPICLEANSDKNLEKLSVLASTISDRVIQIDSAERIQLHLAAVFVCNFVNHFYSIGEKLLQEHQLDFNLLLPLISETTNKVLQFSPEEVQTGPAIRGNQPIIDLHLKMLEKHPEWQKIYELISNDIKLSHS